MNHFFLVIFSYQISKTLAQQLQAEDFKNLCFGCVSNGYTFCSATGNCHSTAVTCENGTIYTTETACNSDLLCPGTGGGHVSLSEKSGSIEFTAPAGNPCHLALFNPYRH